MKDLIRAIFNSKIIFKGNKGTLKIIMAIVLTLLLGYIIVMGVLRAMGFA